MPASVPGGQPAGRRRGVLPGSGGAPSPRGIRHSRGGLSKREPVGLGTTAGAGPAALRARPHRRGGRRNSPRGERHERPARTTRLLPAYVEIMLATGDIPEARNGCRELEEIAQSFDADVLGAMAAHARGAVELAEGNARAALGSLRCAFEVWRQVEAPYAAARVRVLLGLACRALGDDEGCELELGAARAVFEQLGGRARPRPRRLARPVHGAGSSAWVDPARAAGASLGRSRQDQQGHRRGAVPQREDGRQAREQHPHQAGRRLAGRGHGLRVRAQADLKHRTLPLGKSPTPPLAQIG